MLGCVVAAKISAQSLSNLRMHTFAITSDTLRLDSFSIVPNSLSLRTENGTLLDTSTYRFFPFASLVIFQKKIVGKINAVYRVYPFALANRRFNKSYAQYKKSQLNRLNNPFIYNPEENSISNFIDFGALDYSGNLTRGFGFGSNQDVVLNSSFNLQVQGMLSKDVEVTAAITDNNIPIQPDGNTQQIQEFDKIFIQLRKDKHTVIVGDFDLYNPNASYFLRYSKKAQGGGYTGAIDLHKYGELKTHLAGGISRGKFARNTLSVSEGNQGPYKLLGVNGEQFIIILANSEEVFINGQKIKRGADQDYVIDYNLGTISFTPRRIITRDLRVVIEFEYTERSYQRTQVDGYLDWQTKKSSVRLGAYSEQDSKNQNIQQTLNNNKKQFLAALGDSVQNALFPGADTARYDVNRIMYALRDTFCQGDRVDSFFVYSTDPLHARYMLTFALVPPGTGRYRLGENTANGRVYEYAVQLDTILCTQVKLGNYEPVIKLVAPQLQQLFTFATDYNINTKNKLSIEAAMSNTDLNTFSNSNDGDNIGFATRAGYSTSISTKRDSAQVKQSLNIDASYEFVQNRFRIIERFRTIEFARDFDLNTQGKFYNEHQAILQTTYIITNRGQFQYRFRSFFQDSIYRGLEHLLGTQWQAKCFRVNISSTFLQSTAQSYRSTFVRPRGNIHFILPKTKGWNMGINFEHEINAFKDRITDTFNTVNSRIWHNYTYYIANADSQRNAYRLEYTLRTEQLANRNGFEPAHRIAHTVSWNGNITTLRNQTLLWNLTYRRVDESDTTLAKNELKNYYLGRIDYSWSVLRGFLKSQTYYEVGAGREQRVQLQYLYTPNRENGEYVWRDDNQDGVKQLSEFYPINSLNTRDSVYFRSFILTPDLIPVNSVQLNEVLNVSPIALLKSAKGFLKVLANFSAFSNLQLTRKIYARENIPAGEYFNPFPTAREDTNIVTLALVSRNSIFYNRLNPKWGAQVDINYAQSHTLLTAGIERRLTRSQGISFRWNIYKQLNWTGGYTNGLRANESDFFKNQQFKLITNDLVTEMSYLFRQQMRVAANYSYAFKSNLLKDTAGGQFAIIHQLGVDLKYTRLQKTTVGVRFSYSSIGYNAKPNQNQQAEYAMLEGLRGGNNFLWNVTIEQKLLSALQLIASYDGRKNGTNPIVHTARVELRAIF